MLQAHPEIIFFLIKELSTNPKRIIAVNNQFNSHFSDILQLIGRKLQIEINSGKIQPIFPFDLILNNFSLNAGMYLHYSITKKLLEFTNEELKI